MEKLNTTYAEVRWTTEDVLSLRPFWTWEQAEEFLTFNENTIRDRMIELGWEVIRDLLT